MPSEGFTYILAHLPNGPLHVGVTPDLVRFLHEHRKNEDADVAEESVLPILVHFEHFDQMEEAIHRTEQLKTWTRDRKLDLIQEYNPRWHDLYVEAHRTYGPNVESGPSVPAAKVRQKERL